MLVIYFCFALAAISILIMTWAAVLDKGLVFNVSTLVFVHVVVAMALVGIGCAMGLYG